MENFLKILTMPDNIPVVGLVISLMIIMWVWLKQVKKIDRLVKNGEEEKIYEEMIK